MPSSAFGLASAAYAQLTVGDRRAGSRLLDAAILIGEPSATAWTRDRDVLRRHWSGSAYVIARNGSVAGIDQPILGGGQSGAALAYTIDPLSRRAVSIIARGAVANSNVETTLATLGLSWRVLPQLTLSAERLLSIGSDARGAWTLRAAGGASGQRYGIDMLVYAEAGLVSGARYAAVQGRADIALPLAAGFSLHPGGGAWTSIQHEAYSITRLDVGPGVRLRRNGTRRPIELSIDYRFRLAGNAAPGSGPVATLSTGF